MNRAVECPPPTSPLLTRRSLSRALTCARTWSVAAAAALMTLLAHPGAALADVFEDVPEAGEYALIYTLDIPDNGNFNVEGLSYSEDLSERFEGSFDRVAYYLELQREGEARRFVYVSGRAPSALLSQIGVPHRGTGAVFQRALPEMNVASNVEGIVTGQNLEGGHLEFWSSNYGPFNAANVPGASNELLDFGDAVSPQGDFGSMQIHNIEARQTLLAYNNWGRLDFGESDLGIGNNTLPGGDQIAHPDWTFRANASEYSLKRLQVLVRPGPTPEGLSLDLLTPTPCQITQRRPGDVAEIAVQGRLVRSGPPIDLIEARLVPLMGGVEVDWQVIDDAPSGSSFAATVEVPSGWYRLELRATADGELQDTTHVEPVGVGEVFITAGQSNAANAGGALTTPRDPRVCARTEEGWRFAADPQPIANGEGGSPWPALGDLLAARFDVPIGFVSVAVGGTYVDQWRPASRDGLYQRLVFATDTVGPHGARALLWHQGESDALFGTSTEAYFRQLREVITSLRADAGWEIPWGVAQVAFVPDLAPAPQAAVRQGQDQVIAQVPGVFEGPLTDDLIGPQWRYDGIHFNEEGLREHAARWNAAIQLDPCDGFEDPLAQNPCDDEPEPEEDAGGTPDAGVEDSDDDDNDDGDDDTPSPPRPESPDKTDGGCACFIGAGPRHTAPTLLWPVLAVFIGIGRRRR